jgi:predicted DNA-binding protein (MmcQ/YjbR family)
VNGAEVQQLASRTASQLAGATHEQPFGPDWDVFKVAGKMFLLLTEARGEPLTILKCEPEYGATLRDSLQAITPGYHMNKRHWITIHGGAEISEGLVEDLVCNSYRLVRGAIAAKPASYA